MSSALTLETLQPILSNPEFLEKVKDFLPKDEAAGKDVSAEDLKGTVLSPQFKQVGETVPPGAAAQDLTW